MIQANDNDIWDVQGSARAQQECLLQAKGLLGISVSKLH